MATSPNAARPRQVSTPIKVDVESHNNTNTTPTTDVDRRCSPHHSHRVRGRDDRGMSPSHRPLSPDVAVAVNRSKEDADRGREEDAGAARRDRDRSRNREHRHPTAADRTAESGSSKRRDKSTDLTRERSRRHSQSSSRRHREHSRDRARDKDRERDRDRDRDHASNRESDRVSHHSRRPDHSRERKEHRSRTDHHRATSRSPSSRKRHRSGSRSRGESEHKKSRRTRSPRRPDDASVRSGHTSNTQPARSHRDRSPPSKRAPSPYRRDRHIEPRDSRDSRRPGRTASPDRGARSHSRSRQQPSSRNRDRELLPHFAERTHSRRRSCRSRSPPASNSHLQPASRRASPVRRTSRPPTASDLPSRRRPTPNLDSRNSSRPGSRDPKSTGGRRQSQGTPHSSGKFDPTSGANSVEVNMASRGNFRGGYHPYSHNSGHGTPNSSYHGSPTGPAHSPYGANGRGWSNQQPYSPQQQYPPQYPQAGYAAPNGPQASYPNHSPPYPPTGPAAQFNQGPSYRGRGGPGGFRGNQFGPGRGGGHRGGFKNPQWTAGGPGAGRGQHAPSIGDAVDLSQPAADRTENSHSGGDADAANGDNPFRPSKDLQVEDTSKPSSTTDEQMPPPNRAPPSGPSSASKFSFAFKASTKPVVAAPKPEVASKFNAVPPRQPQSQSHSQSQSQSQQSSERDRDRRDLPRGVPTEPASSRSRRGDDRHQQQQQQPRAEPPPPRVRMVKKTMKRLKKKTLLAPELAASDSVYFRKPGDKSVIGSGTYGKVFKGLNVYTKKLVALKKIKMEGERDGFPVTAVREIKLLQSLKHLNIVNLQEVMVEKNDCFMVFEYMSHDLTGLLNHPTYKLNPAQKKDLAKQMFDGLDYLHKRGVLHRDIKAANILVSSDGILKLADFGLARFYAKRHQLDYTNRVITIWYRSPELLLGETQYGPAVDIWSAACVLVEIFTKHAIFPGNGTEVNQLEKIYDVLGTPNKQDWPNLPEMPWFELLRPTHPRKASTFAEKYKERLTPAGYDLLCALFRYDPAKRPTAAEVLEHAYFSSEEPAPKQAVELQNLDGDWHELESKALRRENERIAKEAKKQAAKEAASATTNNNSTSAAVPPPSQQQQQEKQVRDEGKDSSREKDISRKRPSENDPATDAAQREAKRVHVLSPTGSDRK